MFAFDFPCKVLLFPTFPRVTLRVHWGHPRGHGKRSLEILRVNRADYTQKWIVITSIPGQ